MDSIVISDSELEDTNNETGSPFVAHESSKRCCSDVSKSEMEEEDRVPNILLDLEDESESESCSRRLSDTSSLSQSCLRNFNEVNIGCASNATNHERAKQFESQDSTERETRSEGKRLSSQASGSDDISPKQSNYPSGGRGLQRERVQRRAKIRILKDERPPQQKGISIQALSPISICSDALEFDDEIVDSELRKALKTLFASGREKSSAEVRKATVLLRERVSHETDASGAALLFALRNIYIMMDTNKGDEYVQQRALVVLGKLAREGGQILTRIVETNGVSIIIQTMIDYKNSSAMQERAVSTLLSLTGDDVARSQIVAARGAECVCWAMTEFQNVRSIQTSGSTALCNLAFGSEESKKRIGKIGGIDAVVSAMEKHSDDADLQARCCLAIRNLTCAMRANQWIAGRGGAIEAVVKAMESFGDNAEVQYQGCVALANVCADEADNRIRAGESGVINAALRTIRANGAHLLVAEHGLALLRNLSIENEENQVQIGIQGGLATVISCLKQNKTEQLILEKGCSALRYLLFSKENRLALYECGGLEMLVRVMRDGSESQAVTESAIYAMGNAVFDYPENKSAIGRYGGIAALVETMSHHLDSAAIQEHGCRALRNLADADELNTRLLAESGAMDAAIFAMMGYPENANIQEQGCAMLFNMAFSTDNMRRMKGLGVEGVVDQARKHHIDNQQVQNQAVALLDHLQLPSALAGDGMAPSSPRLQQGPLLSSFLSKKGSGRMDSKRRAYASLDGSSRDSTASKEKGARRKLASFFKSGDRKPSGSYASC